VRPGGAPPLAPPAPAPLPAGAPPLVEVPPLLDIPAPPGAPPWLIDIDMPPVFWAPPFATVLAPAPEAPATEVLVPPVGLPELPLSELEQPNDKATLHSTKPAENRANALVFDVADD
jgi:hypothetical protein